MPKEDFIPKLRQLRLTSRKMVDGIYSGNYRSVFKGPGLEFDEVREYDIHDEARFIDWNVSSRMNAPFTKTFREERELTLALVVDLSTSLNAGSGPMSKRDVLNITYANLAYAAASHQDKVGAFFFTDRVEKQIHPAKGSRHALTMIQEVLTYEPKGQGSNLALALQTVHESMKRRGLVVVLSDFKAEGYWKELALVARKHDVISVMITDPLDYEFPAVGLIEISDSETGHSVQALGRSPRFAQSYHDFWTLHRLFWKRECRHRGIHTLEISTTEDPAAKLLTFFNSRRGRR